MTKEMTREKVLKELSNLTQVEWRVFGEYLLVEIGYDNDYYEGWGLTPRVVQEILTCDVDILLKVYTEIKSLV